LSGEEQHRRARLEKRYFSNQFVPVCEIGVSILSLTVDTARISVSPDPFGPTVARLKRKCPCAAETNSDHQDSRQ
jgi:hypothetical protein